MKKIILFLFMFFSLVNKANCEAVKIITNHPEFPMKITYQICPLNRNLLNCDPLQQIYIYHDEKEIELPNFAFYVRVFDALEINQMGERQAYGFFPGDEDCKGFSTVGIRLQDNNDGHITCLRVG
jgi:hypothetical protein